ncbi:MAG: thioredoxin family protein [Armatimonadota bacterium]|jgi:small redox-active disulfide protein 2
MKLTVYGPGCPRCERAEEVVREAVRQSRVEAEVEEVTDISQMAEAGVLMTPAVAIDGNVVISGEVPDVADVVSLITSAASEQ